MHPPLDLLVELDPPRSTKPAPEPTPPASQPSRPILRSHLLAQIPFPDTLESGNDDTKVALLLSKATAAHEADLVYTIGI